MTPNNLRNIFEHLPGFPQENEIVDIIIKNNDFIIERIVSTGQSSKPDFWYEQEWNEFVIILSGSAILKFEDLEIKLKPGDYLDIPAFRKHRVESTDDKLHTVWLAVHYKNEPDESSIQSK